MNLTRIVTTGVILLGGLLAGFMPAGAGDQDVAPAIRDPRPPFDRMARFLASARQFQTTVRIGFEVVQDTGQKIEFSERHRITITRPNRLRADIRKSNGETGMILFDGQTITAYSATHAVYAQVQKAGDLDEVLEYFLRDLEMRLPLAIMFRSDFPEAIENRLKNLEFVEISAVTKVPCVHLAGRTSEIDFQVWIPEKGDPLPRRLTITYRDEEGQPRFWADFEEWRMAPAISATDFAFTPPADARRIPFLAEIERALADEDQKGGD